MSYVCRGGLVVLLGCGLSAAAAAEPAAPLRAGGDLRLREEAFSDVPNRPGDYNYFRVRTRLWTEWDAVTNVTLRLRAVNEFRIFEKPNVAALPQAKSWEAPDEVVFDNLYLDLRRLADDRLDLRLGRQELCYGTGKILWEGSPGDGSRTLYFNAAKATWRGVPQTTIDFLGFYNPSEDQWALNAADRDLTYYTRAQRGVSESGGGFYLVNHSVTNLPFELYDIYKHEDPWNQAAGTNGAGGYAAAPHAWQTLDGANWHNPSADINTLGVRLMPKFNKGWEGNLETAWQYGERGEQLHRAYLVDGALTCHLPVENLWAPAVDAGVLYLSGDAPDTATDEGWDPLWGRHPGTSELYIFTYPDFWWSNLLMPHAGLALSPLKNWTSTASVNYLLAPEKDQPGRGSVRGMLYRWKNEFTLREHWLRKKDRLSGHLWLELLEPGNYYAQTDMAWFARWQLAYEF